MGKLTLAEEDRRGIATIRELHAATFAGPRISVNPIFGHDDDVRLRRILTEIDPTDPSTVDAWEELVLCVVRNRRQRDEAERRRVRRERMRNVTSGESFWRMSQAAAGSSSSSSLYRPSAPPRRVFVEHDDEYPEPPRRHSTRRSRFRPLEVHPTDSSTLRLEDPELDDPEVATGLDSRLVLNVDRPMPIVNDGDADGSDYHSTTEPSGRLPPSIMFSWMSSGFNDPSSPSPEPRPEDDATRDPPHVLDPASPSFPHYDHDDAEPERSRSTSPDAASRAWLDEYAANASYQVSLGRRRRDDDAGPTTRRRLRHTDVVDLSNHATAEYGTRARDTRRDGVVFPSSVDGWLGSALRDHGSDGESAAAPAQAPPGLVRTVSLSAVGGGDRPVARLPRRPASMLRAD